VAKRADQLGPELIKGPLDHGPVEQLFRGEVVQQRGSPNAGPGRDVGQPSRGVADRRELGLGGLEDPLRGAGLELAGGGFPTHE